MDYFLNTYKECRAAFRASAKAALKTFPHSVRETLDIPRKGGEIDTVLLRARKKPSTRLIVLTSGVHGVEGFVGSAIQRRIMDDLIATALPPDCDVLLIHGINPHGFRRWRRVNEHNVDLNRNFYFKREKVPKKEKNRGFRSLKSFFVPGLPFTFWPLEMFIFALRFTGIMLRIGPRKFTDAAVNGQFEFKRGIYYGGRKPEPVVKQLREFLKRIVDDYKGVLMVDIHTGYGEKDGLLLIQNAPRGSSEDANLERITSGLPLLRPGSGENFYKTAGDFTDFLGRIFPQRSDFFPVTLELGTVGNLRFFGAMRSSFLVVAENRIHHQGAWFPASRKIVRERFLRLFYPASEQWRKNAMEKSVAICRELFLRFSGVSIE